MSIHSPVRLKTLLDLELMDTPPEESFDRITRLATRLLQVPVALFTLIGDERQFFKSAHGLPDADAKDKASPLTYSICQYVVDTCEPIVVENAREHPIIKYNLAVTELGVGAYLGIPILAPESLEAIGSLCAIDLQPRNWSRRDIAVLNDLAELIMTDISLRQEIRRSWKQAHAK